MNFVSFVHSKEKYELLTNLASMSYYFLGIHLEKLWGHYFAEKEVLFTYIPQPGVYQKILITGKEN